NVFESVADALLERTVAAPTTRARVFLPVGRRTRRAWRRGNVNGRRLLRHCDRFGFAAAAHRTSVNSRLQRTVQGQRHASQACAPSLIEKKMICALPIMFS